MRRLRRLTAFEIDLGFDSFTGQCYAEVRTIGVICVGPSETEALGRLMGVVLRIMADRLEQGREVPDVVRGLFWSDLTIESSRDKSGRWIAKIPSVAKAHCVGSSQHEVVAKIRILALRIIAGLAEAGHDVPWAVSLLFPLSDEYLKNATFVGAGPLNLIQFPAPADQTARAGLASRSRRQFQKRKTALVATSQPCLFD